MDNYCSLFQEINNQNNNIVAFKFTVEGIPPNTNVYATTALTSFEQGIAFEGFHGGWAATGIIRWDVFNPDGSIATVQPTDPPDLSQNFEYIDNCASITFELAVFQGNACSRCDVFTR